MSRRFCIPNYIAVLPFIRTRRARRNWFALPAEEFDTAHLLDQLNRGYQ